MKKIIAFIVKFKVRFILLAVGLIGYSVFGKSSSTTEIPTEADTVAVERSTLSSTLQVLGSTNLVTSQKLTFGAGGRVTKINVKQGDEVKKGQVLAEIDRRDADNEIKGQQLSIQSAQISYDKLFSNTKPYQITQVELNAENAKGNVETSKLELAQLKVEQENKIKEQENIIAQKEQSLAIINAQGTTNDIQDYSAQAVSAQNDALDSLQQGRDALRTLNDMFHTDQLFHESLFYIGGKVSGLVGTAQTEITKLNGSIETFQPIYDTYVSTTPKTLAVVLALQSANKTYLNQFSKTAQAASTAITNSLIDPRYYSESQFNSDRSTVNSLNNKVLSLLNSINNNIKQSQTNDTSRLTLQNDIATAKRNIDMLNLQYNLQIAQKENEIISTQGNVEVYSQNAESLLAGPTADEKAAIQNQIAQANLNLAKSQKKLEDYQIIAQFDGVVTAIDFKVGDQVTAMTNGITVEVPGIYEVNVLFDQLDIVKINLGQEAKVVFDAYPNEEFTGTISSIDPTPQTDQGVVSYKATIVLQKGGKNIYNSMSATVDVTIDKKENVLTIPALSVNSSGDLKTVQVWNNGNIKVTEIKTGLNDGRNVEVVSGLEEGQKVTKKQFRIVSKEQGFTFGPQRGSGQRMQNPNAGSR